MSTVLQGFYQSQQATAAVQVNNIHIVRGMLGKPGCGTLAAALPAAPTAWVGPQTNEERPMALKDVGRRLCRSGAVLRHVASGRRQRVTRCRCRARARST